MQSKPLKTIVSEFLASSDQSSHQFWRLYTLARRGLQNEFNLDITGSFRTELLNINANKTVAIPDWCVTFSKIGIVNTSGEIVTLKINNQMTSYHSIYFNNTSRTQGLPTLNTFGYGEAVPTGFPPYFYPGYYLNYAFSGGSYNLFGLPSGTATIGTYTIDIANGIILFNSQFPYTQILFEGMTDGFNEDENDYLVPIEAAETMVYWIRWQNMVDMPKKFGMAQIKEARKEYYNEKRKSKVRLNKPDLLQIQNAERESWTLTPKA